MIRTLGEIAKELGMDRAAVRRGAQKAGIPYSLAIVNNHGQRETVFDDDAYEALMKRYAHRLR